MCYDIAYMTKRAERYAEHYRLDESVVEKQMKKNPPVFHVQGFAHPDIPVITENHPHELQFFHWGLIPFWVKDAATAAKISNQTLNARGEEMFGKPSFRASARKRRCIVVVDGFYEHHWKDGVSFPYYITRKDGSPISLGGLWEYWKLESEGIERNTVSIVTCAANPFMEWIHNKPKASEGPRMPLIIPEDFLSKWLTAPDDPPGIQEVKELIQPYDNELLQAHAVQRLRGKQYPGNISDIQNPIEYAELGNDNFR